MEEVLLLKKRLKRTVIFVFTIVIFCIITLILMNKYVLQKEYYTAGDFKIKTIYSKIDYNKNGIDDYSDILLGARKNLNKSVSEEEFVVYSFKYAGYNIKKMVVLDWYENELDTLDNFKKYLNRNTKKLTNNINKIKEFQPGDILLFDDKYGIISDKRNKKGYPFVIYKKVAIVEEDILGDITIDKHYRFDTSLIKDEILA